LPTAAIITFTFAFTVTRLTHRLKNTSDSPRNRGYRSSLSALSKISILYWPNRQASEGLFVVVSGNDLGLHQVLLS